MGVFLYYMNIVLYIVLISCFVKAWLKFFVLHLY